MRHKFTFGYLAFTLLLIVCEPLSRPYDMLLTLIVIILLFFSAIMFLVQLVHAIRDRFKDKQRVLLLLLIPAVILFFPLYMSYTIDNLYNEHSLFRASREGVAGCGFNFELVDPNRFQAISVCFGTDVSKGTYTLKGDTILFEDVSSNDDKLFYAFGLVKQGIHTSIYMVDTSNVDTFKYLHLYRNYNDTVPYWLPISHNEVFKF